MNIDLEIAYTLQDAHQNCNLIMPPILVLYLYHITTTVCIFTIRYCFSKYRILVMNEKSCFDISQLTIRPLILCCHLTLIESRNNYVERFDAYLISNYKRKTAKRSIMPSHIHLAEIIKGIKYNVFDLLLSDFKIK